MNTKKALSRWTVFYVGLLIVSVIYNSIYTFQFYDFSDLFINYQGGFIRRGLLGEIFYQFYLKGINPVYLAYIISLLSYIVIVVYMIRNFRKHGYALEFLPISFLLGGIGIFGLAFFRRDFIIMCIFLLIVKLWKSLPFRWWVLCGNILAILAVLCHEPFAFWAFPLLLLITRLKVRYLWKTICCWIPSMLVFLLCLHFSGSMEQYLLIRKSTEPFLEFPNVMDFLSYDKGYVMLFHLHYNFLDKVFHIPNYSLHVMSSHYEGQGIVMLEAQVCGLPSVTFDFKYGANEIIRDEINGIIVRQNDNEVFIKAICKMINSESLRHNLGMKAQTMAIQYSKFNIFQKWLELLRCYT
jgi:hypothetical protein